MSSPYTPRRSVLTSVGRNSTISAKSTTSGFTSIGNLLSHSPDSPDSPTLQPQTPSSKSSFCVTDHTQGHGENQGHVPRSEHLRTLTTPRSTPTILKMGNRAQMGSDIVVVTEYTPPGKLAKIDRVHSIACQVEDDNDPKDGEYLDIDKSPKTPEKPEKYSHTHPRPLPSNIQYPAPTASPRSPLKPPPPHPSASPTPPRPTRPVQTLRFPYPATPPHVIPTISIPSPPYTFLSLPNSTPISPHLALPPLSPPRTPFSASSFSPSSSSGRSPVRESTSSDSLTGFEVMREKKALFRDDELLSPFSPRTTRQESGLRPSPRRVIARNVGQMESGVDFWKRFSMSVKLEQITHGHGKER